MVVPNQNNGDGPEAFNILAEMGGLKRTPSASPRGLGPAARPFAKRKPPDARPPSNLAVAAQDANQFSRHPLPVPRIARGPGLDGPP